MHTIPCPLSSPIGRWYIDRELLGWNRSRCLLLCRSQPLRCSVRQAELELSPPGLLRLLLCLYKKGWEWRKCRIRIRISRSSSRRRGGWRGRRDWHVRIDRGIFQKIYMKGIVELSVSTGYNEDQTRASGNSAKQIWGVVNWDGLVEMWYAIR